MLKVDFQKSYAAFKQTRRSLRAVAKDYGLNPNTVYTFMRGGYLNVSDPPPPIFQKITEMLAKEKCLVLKGEGKGAKNVSGPGKNKPGKTGTG